MMETINLETGEVSETIIDQVDGLISTGSTSREGGNTLVVEEVIEEIRTLNETDGNLRWRISDLIGILTEGVTSSKDKKEIIQYIATETNIETGTVRQYDWMARAYPTGPIREISPFLTWSHYRACASFETIDERREWLERANDNLWSVTALIEEIAKSKETEGVKIGVPCSRIGCRGLVSEEPSERVIVNAYGYKLVCCSVSCATNVLVNGLNKIKARILGDVEPADGVTPLILHPDVSKREEISQGDYEIIRNTQERAFFQDKIQRNKR